MPCLVKVGQEGLIDLFAEMHSRGVNIAFNEDGNVVLTVYRDNQEAMLQDYLTKLRPARPWIHMLLKARAK